MRDKTGTSNAQAQHSNSRRASPLRRLFSFVPKSKTLTRTLLVMFALIAAVWFIHRQAQIAVPDLEVVNRAEQLSFYSHWETRLPKYKKLFVEAADKHGIDWPLLTAIGYQESKWRENAVSPTGVRGLMMLTRATAKELGVEDRTKPEESIFGGAQYLEYLLSRAPDQLDEEGKLWFAVSAYNGGINRVRTAFRQWSSIEGITPDWFAFERDMLGAEERSALRISMLYTRHVRDYYRIASSIVANGR